ncbi:hypothetical protein QMN07_18495 [Leptospira santarosai]|uniref:hypothetical protein n=1 Tax=Leptospira santarosai TaxID=28183 RepID=UPI0024AF2700|nr:hypothetical protein [Leptospira santarosai]MDI7219478.1 hypothetical protein [Leptospira santarosai]
MRTGVEMYANDAMVDKVVSTTLAVTGIIGTVLSFTPFAPIGLSMVGASALGMAAWKSFREAYEGGAAGAAAGIASTGREVNYDNLSGYSASLQAASAMFGDTPLKMTSSLTWSEQNGFNGSVSYNILTKEQLAKEAAKAAQKGAQQNQGNLFLNIMDGIGFNLGGREGLLCGTISQELFSELGIRLRELVIGSGTRFRGCLEGRSLKRIMKYRYALLNKLLKTDEILS